MKIQELATFSEADLRDMDELMHQLSESSYCSEERLHKVIEDVNSHLYVVVVNDNDNHNDDVNPNGRIVGCACLCVAHTPEFTLGFVEV